MAISIPPEESLELFPVLVGVTGHRDLIDDVSMISQLKGSITEEFRQLKSNYPDCPIILVTGLAEGADRLAVNAVRELEIADIKYAAVLPMPKSEYEKDFNDAKSLLEFRELWQKAEYKIELPILDTRGRPLSAWTVVDRNLQYEQLGLYLATNCHVLIALWDGIDSAKPGGTAYVVNMRLGEKLPHNPALVLQQKTKSIGCVTHILTPRKSNPRINGIPFESKILPEGNSPVARERANVYEKILQNIQDANRDIINQATKYKAKIEESIGYIIENPLPASADDRLDDYIFKYGIMDSLAIRFKSYRFWMLKVFFGLILAAFIWFELHVEICQEINPVWVVGYPAFFGAAAILYLVIKKRRLDEKHEDYRVIAEALRVQIYWRLAGMNCCVENHCIPKQIGELSWIRLALFGWNVPHVSPAPVSPPEINYVQSAWVKGQGIWYADKSGEFNRLVNKRAMYVMILMIVSVVIALLLIPMSLLKQEISHDLFEIISIALIVLTGTTLVSAAVLHGYTEKQALAEQSKQYEHMGHIFLTSYSDIECLHDAGYVSDVTEKLFILGKEALTEHCDWLIMHRARPLEVTPI